MAKIAAQCEFMNNAFPAGQLQLRGHFYVVEDENGEHMIFSADKDGKLCLIVKGPSGHNELINLSEHFQVPEDHVIGALAVSQNADGKIHLVFTSRQSGGADILWVVRPMAPKRTEWIRDFDASQDIFTGEQSNIYIREVLLVCSPPFYF